MQLNRSVTELAFCRARLPDDYIVEFCDSEARRGILNGSIKNWPSILCCCLGGVRGIAQIVNLIEEAFYRYSESYERRLSTAYFAMSDTGLLFERNRPARSIVDCLLVYIHMLQQYTAAMHQSLSMQNERIIEGQVDSAFVP